MDYKNPEWITRRDSALQALATKVTPLLKNWNQIVNTHPAKGAWELPKEAHTIRNDLQKLAKESEGLVYKPLRDLQNWLEPEKNELAHPDRFYDGIQDKVMFNRTHKWLEDMGFKKYETPYTYSHTWDKQEINVTFLVPKDLPKDEETPVMWFIHGGGFCTGAGDHIPWHSSASLLHARAKKAIIIAPDYPLGPEANYQDIATSLREFLIWYKSDGFFRTDSRPYDNWTAWLADQTKTRPINPATNPIFVHGESAGGHAVVTSMFLNAEKSVGLDLPIKIALLRYPMVKHYTRLFPATGTLTYMGKSVTHAETIARRRAFEREIWLLEKYGLVPARSKGFAPQWMSCAFVLATTGRWKTMFQRSHGPYTQALIEGNADLGAEIAWPAVGSENEGSWDCVERAKGSMDKVEHGKLPRVVMYHGTGDGNYLVGDTRELRDVLVEKYPGRYNEETAFAGGTGNAVGEGGTG